MLCFGLCVCNNVYIYICAIIHARKLMNMQSEHHRLTMETDSASESLSIPLHRSVAQSLVSQRLALRDEATVFQWSQPVTQRQIFDVGAGTVKNWWLFSAQKKDKTWSNQWLNQWMGTFELGLWHAMNESISGTILQVIPSPVRIEHPHRMLPIMLFYPYAKKKIYWFLVVAFNFRGWD